ncbi:uncharacterized protein JCM6883_000333 [Sporobolomyces salmoneus]|uniref:uncharacterized protein n=1 Tax=Sporobolomyces salmoneus TaxID=183962 RepID=UPI00317FB3E5
MHVSLSLPLLLLALATSAQAAVFRSPNVKALLSRSFKKAVQGSPKQTVSIFYAPWCGYCKQLAPEADKVADSLKGLVNIVSVDCDEDQNKQLCGEYGVKGFPTIKIFPGGSAPPRNYDGPRTAKDIISHATSTMPTFVKRAASLQDIKGLKSKASKKPISLLFTSAGKVTPLYKALSTDFHQSLDFYAARDTKIGPEGLEVFGVEKLPSLLVLKGGDQVEKYEGPIKYDKVHAFLSKHAGTSSSGAKEKKGHSEL